MIYFIEFRAEFIHWQLKPATILSLGANMDQYYVLCYKTRNIHIFDFIYGKHNYEKHKRDFTTLGEIIHEAPWLRNQFRNLSDIEIAGITFILYTFLTVKKHLHRPRPSELSFP